MSLPESLVKSIKVLGGDKFSTKVDTLIKACQLGIFEGVLPTGRGLIRKLSQFPDKEEKVRVIAILDYFSQASLRPLHDFLYSILRRIPQDKTFDQSNFKKTLSNCEVYYSVDLSQATDRFPISLIASVLKARIPEHYVDS